MIIKKIIDTSKKVIVPIQASRDNKLQYAREQILFTLSYLGFYVGILILIPSFIASIYADLIVVAVFDVIVYLMLVVFLVVRSIPFKYRVKGIAAIFYLIGVIIILLLGPHGAGFIWLFAYPLFAGLLMGLKQTYISIFILTITVTLIGAGIYFEIFGNLKIMDYPLFGWIAVSINYLGLMAFIAISMGILLEALAKALNNEIKIMETLKNRYQEMSELKHKAEESDRLKSTFLANMSHEIRTPMNAIIGFSNLLEKRDLNEEKRIKYLRIVSERAQYLLALINDIIDIAKIEANKLKLQIEECHLNKLMDELYSITELMLKQKNSESRIKLSYFKSLKNDESKIYTDSIRLKQILNNLLNNAVKFTNSGKIEFGYKLDDNNCLLFFVKDTGIGIPQDKLEFIFERFGQVGDIVSGDDGGAGLGLSISKTLVKLMDGEIRVESIPGKGSTFSFTLPLKPVP